MDDRVRLQLGLVAVTIVTLYTVYRVFLSPRSKSSVKCLRGPQSASYLAGNMKQMLEPDLETLENWLEVYGTTFAAHDVLSSKLVYSADPIVASYVLNNPMLFQKPELLRRIIEYVLGPGVFAAEGETSKRQVSNTR